MKFDWRSHLGFCSPRVTPSPLPCTCGYVADLVAAGVVVVLTCGYAMGLSVLVD